MILKMAQIFIQILAITLYLTITLVACDSDNVHVTHSSHKSNAGFITNRPTGSPSVFQVGDQFKIVQPQRSLYEDYGIVSGVRQCGGVGKVTKWRYEPCITGLAPPCVVPSVNSGENRLEVHFIPSENIDVLGIQVRVSAGEEFLHFEDTIKNSSVVAGQPYALFVGAGPTEEWKGSVSTTHVTLFRESDRQIEICTEGEFFII